MRDTTQMEQQADQYITAPTRPYEYRRWIAAGSLATITLLSGCGGGGSSANLDLTNPDTLTTGQPSPTPAPVESVEPPVAGANQRLFWRGGPSGSEVVKRQMMLRRIGCNLLEEDLTGTFGQKTEREVRRFQNNRGLEKSGAIPGAIDTLTDVELDAAADIPLRYCGGEGPKDKPTIAEPAPKPVPSATTTQSATPRPTTASPTPTTARPSPSRTVSPSPSRTVTPSPSRTVSPSPSRTATPSPSRTVSPSPSRTTSPSPSRTVSPSPNRTTTKEATPSDSPCPTSTPTTLRGRIESLLCSSASPSPSSNTRN